MSGRHRLDRRRNLVVAKHLEAIADAAADAVAEDARVEGYEPDPRSRGVIAGEVELIRRILGVGD